MKRYKYFLYVMVDKIETDKLFNFISNLLFSYEKDEEPSYTLMDYSKLRYHFVCCVRTAAIHWFFVQALDAIKHNLYIPAALSFLNGIEASLRIEVAYLKSSKASSEDCFLIKELDKSSVLSNRLIKEAGELGLPIKTLAFPSEKDFFFNKLGSNNRVKIVEARHDVCHGNILKFINEEFDKDDPIFTPECLIPLTKTLFWISYNWVEALGCMKGYVDQEAI